MCSLGDQHCWRDGGIFLTRQALQWASFSAFQIVFFSWHLEEGFLTGEESRFKLLARCTTGTSPWLHAPKGYAHDLSISCNDTSKSPPSHQQSDCFLPFSHLQGPPQHLYLLVFPIPLHIQPMQLC